MNSLIPKIIISVICTILFVLLIRFGDRVFPEQDTGISSGQEGNEYQDAFRFDSDEITYDGSGELDLLEGVSLKGFTVDDLKEKVFTQIYPGDTLSEKIVQYTADTDAGRVRSKRKLRLTGYEGPKIVLPDEIPTVTPETMNGFGGLLQTKDGYAVDDGFGNDMRDYVDISCEEVMKDSSLLRYTIGFSNMFGDRDVVRTDVVLTGVPARVILTDSEVTVNVGDNFDARDYILSAEMADGKNAADSVNFRCDVDTAAPGSYIVDYELEGRKAALTVNVE